MICLFASEYASGKHAVGLRMTLHHAFSSYWKRPLIPLWVNTTLSAARRVTKLTSGVTDWARSCCAVRKMAFKFSQLFYSHWTCVKIITRSCSLKAVWAEPQQPLWRWIPNLSPVGCLINTQIGIPGWEKDERRRSSDRSVSGEQIRIFNVAQLPW